MPDTSPNVEFAYISKYVVSSVFRDAPAFICIPGFDASFCAVTSKRIRYSPASISFPNSTERIPSPVELQSIATSAVPAFVVSKSVFHLNTETL